MAPNEFRLPYQFCVSLLFCSFLLCFPVHAQQQTVPSTDKQPAPENPAQIELLETRYRFEASGDSRKEVHARVKINTELGVRQFARLNFDYNRSFESIDLPLVRITHPSGGTVDILPSAITDNPNPAVLNAPAYQDVRVKSVRILGLAPGDLLEYHVITTTTHHPLAPDFWLDHSFDRTGVVSHEIFELDLPGSLYFEAKFPPGCNLEWMVGRSSPLARVRVCGSIPFSNSLESSSESTASRSLLHWDVSTISAHVPGVAIPDVMVSTFDGDGGLSLVERLAAAFNVNSEDQRELQLQLQAIATRSGTSNVTLQDAYEFVSQKLATVDLPVGATGFRLRAAKDVLNSGYATPEEKCMLLAAFARALGQVSRSAHANPKQTTDVQIVLLTSHRVPEEPICPSTLEHPLVVISDRKQRFALDPSLEAAPFAFIAPRFRGRQALTLTPYDAGDYLTSQWIVLPSALPFAASQRVNVEATLTADGTLNAKVRYLMRGDSELPLRQAFHQSPKDKWKELAQLLSLSDGFRGPVTRVNASDPYATREPFTLDYEITMPKFVDWSKKPVHIPALLPQIGLPDPPAKPSPGAAASPIELGTPLEVKTQMTLHLPPGTTTQTPTGTAVQRDYATFASQYSAKGPIITASRHISFLLRQIPAERAADYNAFLRAVRNDEAQDFTLDRPAAAPPNLLSPKPPKTVSPTKQARP